MRTGVLKMKDRITPYLEVEIVSRAHGESEAIHQQLGDDVVYHRAMQLLADPDEMQKILRPKAN